MRAKGQVWAVSGGCAPHLRDVFLPSVKQQVEKRQKLRIWGRASSHLARRWASFAAFGGFKASFSWDGAPDASFARRFAVLLRA